MQEQLSNLVNRFLTKKQISYVLKVREKDVTALLKQYNLYKQQRENEKKVILVESMLSKGASAEQIAFKLNTNLPMLKNLIFNINQSKSIKKPSSSKVVKKSWTPEEIEILKEMRDAGASYDEIGKKLSRTRDSISKKVSNDASIKRTRPERRKQNIVTYDIETDLHSFPVQSAPTAVVQETVKTFDQSDGTSQLDIIKYLIDTKTRAIILL